MYPGREVFKIRMKIHAAFFAHNFAYTISSQRLVYWQSLWQIRQGVCEICDFEKWGAIQPLKYSSNNLSWSHISKPTWPRNFRLVLFKSPWLDSVHRNTSDKVKVLFTICCPPFGVFWLFVCFFPFLKPSNIPSVWKTTVRQALAGFWQGLVAVWGCGHRNTLTAQLSWLAED